LNHSSSSLNGFIEQVSSEKSHLLQTRSRPLLGSKNIVSFLPQFGQRFWEKASHISFEVNVGSPARGDVLNEFSTVTLTLLSQYLNQALVS
jgi:hypothetical protein